VATGAVVMDMAVVVGSVNGSGSGNGSGMFSGSVSVTNLYALGLLAHIVLCGLGFLINFFSLFKLLGILLFFFLLFLLFL